jgi:hypothetical protein
MKLLLCFGLFLTGYQALAGERNPVGETAFYQLDKNSRRTSSVIKNGNFVTQVNGESANTSVPSFDVAINYEFDVAWMGNQSGAEKTEMDQSYFTEEFLEDLRVNKTFESEQFKVRHIGFADAVNMDGRRYENCDLLHFYDIDTGSSQFLPKLISYTAHAMLIGSGSPLTGGSIENLQIIAHVKYGAPVLGAVKIDVSGKTSGMKVKAGGDYIPR